MKSIFCSISINIYTFPKQLQDTLQGLRDHIQKEEKEKMLLQEQLIQAQDKLAATATQVINLFFLMFKS